MKFITSKSIDAGDFKKESFTVYDSLESIVKNTLNSKNLYILEVEYEENPVNKFLLKTHLASKKGKFKNHYSDKNGKIIKVKRIVTLNEMNEAGASSEYFYSFAVNNAVRLENRSLGIIIKFLTEKNIDPDLLISFCAKVNKLGPKEISVVEDYLFKKIISIDMIIEFANKVQNYNIEKLITYVLEYYSEDEALVKFINSVNNCNMNEIIRHIIKKDTCPQLSNSMSCLRAIINNNNFNFEVVEDAFIEKDKEKEKKGEMILALAKEFNNIVNIDKLTKAIDEADNQGFLCLKFLLEVKGVDTQFLERRIAEKDKIGLFCRELSMRPGANLELLTNRVIELKIRNKAIILSYVETIDAIPKTGKYQETLLKHLIDTDASPRDIYNFILTSTQLGANAIQSAVDKIKEDDKSEEIVKNIKMHTVLKPYI